MAKCAWMFMDIWCETGIPVDTFAQNWDTCGYLTGLLVIVGVKLG